LGVEVYAGQGAEVFVMEKQHSTFAQALLFGVIQAIEDRQVLQYGLPLRAADGMTGKDTLATPGA